MRVGAVQLNSTDDVDRNLETADRLTRAAAAAGAELVVLPEKWPALGRIDVIRIGAQGADGPAIRWAKATARELGIDLVAGSVAMRAAGGDRLRNTLVHAGPDGELAATYTKIHMFDVEVDGTAYLESEHEDHGDGPVTSETAGGARLGLTICYDLRFPSLFEALGHMGVDGFVVPSAFTFPTTRDHWPSLVRARAIEQQAFVVAANQIGRHPPDYRSGGWSMIVDAWGTVLAQAPDAECHIVADVDLEHQASVRRRIPALRHRKPDAYRPRVEA